MISIVGTAVIAQVVSVPTVLISLFGLAFMTIIGVIYRKLTTTLQNLEQQTEANSKLLQDLSTRLFGADRDETDSGVTGELAYLTEEVDTLEARVGRLERRANNIEERLDEDRNT